MPTTTTEREKSAEEGEEKKSAEEGEEKQSAEDGEEEEKEGEGSGETGAEGDRETGGQEMEVDKGAAVDEVAAPGEEQSAADDDGDGERAVLGPQSQAAQAETEEEEGEDNMLEATLVADSPTSPDYSPKTLAEMGASME